MKGHDYAEIKRRIERLDLAKTELMKEAEVQARKLGMGILTLEVFVTNSRARHVYEKVGHRVVGRVPKANIKNGVYIDSIIMAKE